MGAVEDSKADPQDQHMCQLVWVSPSCTRVQLTTTGVLTTNCTVTHNLKVLSVGTVAAPATITSWEDSLLHQTEGTQADSRLNVRRICTLAYALRKVENSFFPHSALIEKKQPGVIMSHLTVMCHVVCITGVLGVSGPFL